MSGAICGLIHSDNKPVCVNKGMLMIDKLNNCKLDITKTLTKHNVFMGCGLLYVTLESKQEILPFHDDEKGLIITADAIIDNRKELINVLEIDCNENEIITDSQLVLKAYEKWQEDCPKYLIGDYTFVIWDENNKKIFAARDHVGGRTLYYKFEKNIFSFSTLIEPIRDKEDLNERWITDFLALPSVMHISECEESIYQGIYELPPAHTLTISKNNVSKKKYWNPLKDVKTLKLRSDKEYDEEFGKIFFEAVNCRLRSENEVSIMLSGGLDSASVACAAAIMLNNEGKKMKAFTSIPMEGFNDDTSIYQIADETEYVDSIGEIYKNIELNYCRSEGSDSLTNMNEFVQKLEQPYKNFQNLFWVNEIVNKVSLNGSKVLLTGQFGNFTISYGDFLTHIKTLLQKGRIFKIINEIKGCSKYQGFSIGFICKKIAELLVFDNIKRIKIYCKNKGDYSKSPVNVNLIKKWDVENRFARNGYNANSPKYKNLRDERNFIMNSVFFSQIGTIETKLSLSGGIVLRDPTKDKRVIEFCLSLPSEQLVRNGEERYLIKRNMKGILPNKIISNKSKKGLQSADWLQRLNPKKEYIYFKLEEIVENETCKKYLDVEKLNKQMMYLKNEEINSKFIDMRLILMSLSLYSFLKGGEEHVKV